MEVVGPLLQQAGFGFMAGVFLWLFLQERKEHKADRAEDRAEIKALQEARINDNKEVTKDYADVVTGNTNSNYLLAEGLKSSQRSNERGR